MNRKLSTALGAFIAFGLSAFMLQSGKYIDLVLYISLLTSSCAIALISIEWSRQ